MSAAPAAIPVIDRGLDTNYKRYRVPRSSFSRAPRILRKAFGGHVEATVMDVLMYRSNIWGPSFSMSLAGLRESTEEVATEPTLSKVLRSFAEDGYILLECHNGSWRGFQITMLEGAIQAAIDRVPKEMGRAGMSTTPAKTQRLTPENFKTIKSSASQTKEIFPPSPPLNPTPLTVEQEEKSFHERLSPPEAQSSTPEEVRTLPPRETPPAAPVEMPAEPEKSLQKPKLVEFPKIPPRVFPLDARAEIRHQFSERFKFGIPFYDLDYIEMRVTARGRTLEEFYSLIATHWAVSTPNNPVGFAKWFAVARMGEGSPSMQQQVLQHMLTFAEPARCDKCKGSGYVAAGQLCDCSMAKDLARDLARQARKNIAKNV